MKRHPRAWRITMWTTLAATVLLAGGAIGSRGHFACWFGRQGEVIGLRSGTLCIGSVPDLAGEGFMTDRFSGEALPWLYDETWPRLGSLRGCSLWLPASATFALSGLSAFMAHRTRGRPGLCAKCGYDRSGLPTDAPCPECGRV